MRQFLRGQELSAAASVGLLGVRLAVGIALMLHGWPKIRNPTVWMGPDGPSAFLQAAAAVSEFVGGGALVIGLLTRPFALLIAITMATAAWMAHISAGHPFVGAPGAPSWELAGVYFAVAILLLLAGSGRISLDARLFRMPSDRRKLDAL